MTRITITRVDPHCVIVNVQPSLLGWLLGADAQEYTAWDLGRRDWCRRTDRDEWAKVPGRVAREIEHRLAIAAVRAMHEERLGRV